MKLKKIFTDQPRRSAHSDVRDMFSLWFGLMGVTIAVIVIYLVFVKHNG